MRRDCGGADDFSRRVDCRRRVLLAPASALALIARRFRLARVLAGTQVTLWLSGWALAQHPYLIAPHLTLAASAASRATLVLTALTLPFGAAALIPSSGICSPCSRGGIRAARIVRESEVSS